MRNAKKLTSAQSEGERVFCKDDSRPLVPRECFFEKVLERNEIRCFIVGGFRHTKTEA